MSLKIKSISSATHKGRRPYQEDRFFTLTAEQGTLVAVFDGHGGDECSQRCSEDFPVLFADAISAPKITVRKALERSIHNLAVQTDYFVPGTTLSAVFIPARGNFVTAAVIGDSPIIIKDSDANLQIGPDHNVRTNYDERLAAEARGGFVSDGYLCASFNGPGLQMARALGDAQLRAVLSRTPEIYRVRMDKHGYIIVATDGAFDPGHYDFKKASESVVSLVEAGAEAQAVVDYAVNVPTGDNVTAIIVRFE